MKQENTIKVRNCLDETDWNSIIQDSNTENAFYNFEEIINDLFMKSFPKIKCKGSAKNIPLNPWMLAGLMKSQKVKEKLFKKKLKKPSVEI